MGTLSFLKRRISAIKLFAQQHEYRKASFTVEASFIFPIIVLLIAFLITLSINLYQGVESTAEKVGNTEEIDTYNLFLTEDWFWKKIT